MWNGAGRSGQSLATAPESGIVTPRGYRLARVRLAQGDAGVSDTRQGVRLKAAVGAKRLAVFGGLVVGLVAFTFRYAEGLSYFD